MSKSEIPVDEVAGDVDPSLCPRGATMRRKGLVGKGLKGGTGIARGDVLKGLRDRKAGAESEGSCADEKGREWNGIGGGGPNEDAPGRGGSEGGTVCNGGT